MFKLNRKMVVEQIMQILRPREMDLDQECKCTSGILQLLKEYFIMPLLKLLEDQL